MVKKFIIIIIIFVMFILTACRQTEVNDIKKSDNEKMPVKNGVLSLYSTNPDTLNPLTTKNKFIRDYAAIIFDKLIAVDDDGICMPSIATDWEQSKDGLVWIIKIRNGLKWHDGEPLTPADVVFSMKTIIGNVDSSYKWNIDTISDVSVYSPDSIKITLKVPDSFIPEKMALPVIPEHYYTGNGLTDESKKYKPIGSGPFKFVSYEPSKQIILAANDDWITRGDDTQIKPPYIREIKIILFDAATSTEKAMNDNKTDLAYVDSYTVSKYIGRNDVNIIKYNNYQFSYIAFNINNGLFMEKYMRQFVSKALDVQSILKETVSSDTVYTAIPVPHESYMSEAIVKNISYDVNKAKDILVQNGWGFNGNIVYSKVKGRSGIEFTILVNNDNPARVVIAEKIKSAMQVYGIKVNVSSVAWDQYLAMYNGGIGFDMAIAGVIAPEIPDPSFMYSSASMFNAVKYNNPLVDKSLQDLQLAWKQEDKAAIIKQIYSVTEDEVPYMGLYYGNDYIAVNKRITGGIKPNKNDLLHDISQWYIPVK